MKPSLIMEISNAIIAQHNILAVEFRGGDGVYAPHAFRRPLYGWSETVEIWEDARRRSHPDEPAISHTQQDLKDIRLAVFKEVIARAASSHELRNTFLRISTKHLLSIEDFVTGSPENETHDIPVTEAAIGAVAELEKILSFDQKQLLIARYSGDVPGYVDNKPMVCFTMALVDALTEMFELEKVVQHT